jgi:hypothetical protein
VAGIITKASLEAGTPQTALPDTRLEEEEQDGKMKAPVTEMRTEKRKNKFMLRIILNSIKVSCGFDSRENI